MANLDTPIHLSAMQKEVMAKIISSSSPTVAWETIMNVEPEIKSNFRTALNTLDRLDLITTANEELTVTDKGKKVMNDSGLLDDSDQLTAQGQELADKDRTIKESIQPFAFIRSLNDLM